MRDPPRAAGLSGAVHSQYKLLIVVAEACAQLFKPPTAKEQEEGWGSERVRSCCFAGDLNCSQWRDVWEDPQGFSEEWCAIEDLRQASSRKGHSLLPLCLLNVPSAAHTSGHISSFFFHKEY